MRLVVCALILVTFGFTSASLSTLTDERTSKKPGDSDNAEPLLGNSSEFSTTFRDFLQMLKTYFEIYIRAMKLHKGSFDVSAEKFQDIIAEVQKAAHYARHTDEFAYALPVYGGLVAVKLAGSDEQKRNSAYSKLGEAFWAAINSDQAIPVLQALSDASTLGELYLINP